MPEAQDVSSCLGETMIGSLLYSALPTFIANVELSVKAGDTGRGIPRPGTTSALAMKRLMARCAEAIRSSNLLSRFKAMVCAYHS